MGVWNSLISGETLRYDLGILQPTTFKMLINSGYKIIRNDKRILGYDGKKDRFYDTKKYLSKKNSSASFDLDKSTFLAIAGIIAYGIMLLGGRFILAEKNMPLTTPGTIHMLPLPERLEYLEKEAQMMDSVNNHKIKDGSAL